MGGVVDGGGGVPMLHVDYKNANVTLSILRNGRVALSILRKGHVACRLGQKRAVSPCRF